MKYPLSDAAAATSDSKVLPGEMARQAAEQMTNIRSVGQRLRDKQR